MSDDPRVLLKVDSRQRITLGEIATQKLYLVDREPDGTIILTPAVVLPAPKEKS